MKKAKSAKRKVGLTRRAMLKGTAAAVGLGAASAVGGFPT